MLGRGNRSTRRKSAPVPPAFHPISIKGFFAYNLKGPGLEAYHWPPFNAIVGMAKQYLHFPRHRHGLIHV
jgi:hypothetical protein